MSERCLSKIKPIILPPPLVLSKVQMCLCSLNFFKCMYQGAFIVEIYILNMESLNMLI